MNRLSICDFGPVKDAVLDLKSFNMLIGEQSIGKSTIAKLIAIFTDNSSLAIIASSGIKAWNFRLRMYDLDIFSDTAYRINYLFEESGVFLSLKISKKRVIVSLTVDGNKIVNRKEIGKRIISMRTMFRQEAFLNSILSELKDLKSDEDVRYQVLSLQALIESSLYVPAERIAYSLNDNLKSALSLLGEDVTYTYRRFMVNLDKARHRSKKYDSEILRMTYLNEDSGQFFIDAASNRKYHLYNASSGIQSTIPLLLVIEDIKNREYSSIVIEEPETNLFPSTQVEVLKLILQKAREGERIVTITTHSPYLLSALNNYLYAGFVAGNLSKEGRKSLNRVISEAFQLNATECSVYSIGESINEDGSYCKSLIDEEIGMINTNTLDRISFSMSEEFDAIQDIYINNIK